MQNGPKIQEDLTKIIEQKIKETDAEEEVGQGTIGIGAETIKDGAEDHHLTKKEERRIIAKIKDSKILFLFAHEIRSKLNY